MAIAASSQEGLDGRALWFPAESTGGEVLRRGHYSAEGGRFWHHEIVAEVVVGADVGDARWVGLGALERLALTSLATSVELRLLLSLVQQAQDS